MENKNRKVMGPGMHGGMGMMGGGSSEKTQKGTWGKLLKYCRKYWILLIIAVVFAAGGTVLTLAGPDKLSEITDEITGGLVPDTDELGKITKDMTENLSDNLKTVMSEVTSNVMQSKGTPKDIEINKAVISGSDQLEMLNMMKKNSAANNAGSGSGTGGSKSGTTDSSKSGFSSGNSELIENMPESVKDAVFTDIIVDGTRITGKEQQETLNVLSSVKEENKDSLKAFDKLPDSVYKLVKPRINLKKIGRIGMTLAIFYLTSFILSVIQGLIMATVTQKTSRRLRSDISGKINRLPMSYFHHHTTGDVLSRVTNDVDTIGSSLNMSVGMLVSSITLFIGSIIMMLKTNVIMTVTGILATMIGFFLMMFIMKKSQKYFLRQQENLGEINGQIEEIYSGHTIVKAYNGEKTAKKKFDELNSKLKHSGFMAQAMSGLMMPIMTFIGNFGYVAVCVTGAMLALDDKITMGVIVSFMIYIRLFTQPLSQIAQAAQQLQSAGAASSRVFDFMGAKEMEDESSKKIEIKNAMGSVEFSNVKFGYEENHIVINNFSTEVKPGQKIAIVGPTGAGKTTIVNLLMRFYEINSGNIMIDGIDTSTVKRGNVHAQFCMVLQDTWIFEGTVRENLIYCSENNSDEKMKKACKAVGLDHFIRTLPDGYDTILNDQVSLSQGQKQQLTIARAMIADKPILILDEATSSIDTRTELQIQKAMDELMKNRTSFVIAHRLSTIKNADKILVLKDGDVIESGTHDELMKQKGFYEDLYNSQFDQAS